MTEIRDVTKLHTVEIMRVAHITIKKEPACYYTQNNVADIERYMHINRFVSLTISSDQFKFLEVMEWKSFVYIENAEK